VTARPRTQEAIPARSRGLAPSERKNEKKNKKKDEEVAVKGVREDEDEDEDEDEEEEVAVGRGGEGRERGGGGGYSPWSVQMGSRFYKIGL
jgi:hypothetical protein